jgi:excisionase family DNA binding protein
MEMSDTTLMTVDDIAKKLNCSTRTVYRLTDRGFVPPPIRLGRLVRWSPEAIDRWLAMGCPKPEKPSTRPALKSP